jgi:hypothetical protein
VWIFNAVLIKLLTHTHIHTHTDPTPDDIMQRQMQQLISQLECLMARRGSNQLNCRQQGALAVACKVLGELIPSELPSPSRKLAVALQTPPPSSYLLLGIGNPLLVYMLSFCGGISLAMLSCTCRWYNSSEDDAIIKDIVHTAKRHCGRVFPQLRPSWCWLLHQVVLYTAYS